MQYPLIYEHNSVRVFKINDSVYYREGNLDERRQCNGGFVVLKDCTVAIDVPSEDGAREMLDESEKLFGLPIKHAFITHAHPDHDLGLPVSAEKGGITVYGAAAAPQEWAARGVTFPGNFIGISGRERVSIEGMDFELEKLPVTAHSPWDMLVYMPAFDLMFTGDLVVNEPILYLEHCDIQNWVKVLGELAGRNITLLARGHGGCVPSSYLADEIRYLKALNNVNVYMRSHMKVAEPDVNDEFMGEVLNRLCAAGNADARYIADVSGPAAYYQMTQFYRYGVKN